MSFKRIIKKCFDFCLAFLGLIFLATPFLIISILIKLDSAGPVFFRQERIGKAGKIFKIWKFRTMIKNADSYNFTVLEIRKFEMEDKDSRITRVGKFLRRFAIDEFPQLINILRGEMSFVGPRPFFLPRIKTNPELLKERTRVLPGLTSLSVIKGDVKLSEEEILRYDLEYIRNQNFLLDLKIFFKTIVIYLRKFYER